MRKHTEFQIVGRLPETSTDCYRGSQSPRHSVSSIGGEHKLPDGYNSGSLGRMMASMFT